MLSSDRHSDLGPRLGQKVTAVGGPCADVQLNVAHELEQRASAFVSAAIAIDAGCQEVAVNVMLGLVQGLGNDVLDLPGAAIAGLALLDGRRADAGAEAELDLAIAHVAMRFGLARTPAPLINEHAVFGGWTRRPPEALPTAAVIFALFDKLRTAAASKEPVSHTVD